MSDFQLALLAIGAAVIVAVVVYNKWQEAQLRRKSERAFASRYADVLMETGPRSRDAAEPAPQQPPRAPTSADQPDLEHTAAAAATTPTAADPAAPRPPLDRLDPVLHPALDYIVELRCARAVAGAVVAQHAHALVDESLVKPVHWEGLDAVRGGWRALAPEERYERVRVGLQLANRAGSVTEDDVLAFCGAVQEVALAIAAEPEFPDTDAAVVVAEALDRFAADVDVQIGLSVIGSDAHAFPGSKIQAAAESAGLAMGRDGRFHRRTEDGTELFTLANLEPMPFHAATLPTIQTRGVTILFDVPCVPPGMSPFRSYIEFAHELEHALGGMLVDDNKKPIGQFALDAISQQLEQIHRTMAEQGMPAGSPLALRLFS